MGSLFGCGGLEYEVKSSEERNRRIFQKGFKGTGIEKERMSKDRTGEWRRPL